LLRAGQRQRYTAGSAHGVYALEVAAILRP
jgi:hypothetical protein